MKNFKRIFVNIIAALLVMTACFGLTACTADVRKVELTVKVFNYDEEVNAFEDVTLTVDLYRHLAPKTVDKMLSYVKDGYYNDNVFYKMADYSKQIMMGDLKVTAANAIVENDIKPQLDGEFERGGTIGSNLTNVAGAVGLWRSWYAWQDSYKTSDSSLNSGRATWYMPTETISSYNTWFCIFALIDLSNESNSDAWDLIKEALAEQTESYTVYYTGTYAKEKADENYGLTFNCVETAQFDENQIDGLFKAENEQLVCYNHYEIKVPVTPTGEIAAKIVSAK
jgi:hypothetical protein